MSDVGRYRKVFTSLWLHPGFLQLNDPEKVIALYLLTGPQTNRIGLYRLSPNAGAEDLETTPESFRKRLGTVCTTFGWLFDGKARVLFIPSWWHWNPPPNENVMRGSLKDLKDLPPCGLMTGFVQNLETIPERFRESFLRGLSELFPSGFPNQDQDLDLRQKKEQEPGAARRQAKSAENDVRSCDTSKLDRVVRLASRHFARQSDLELKLDTIRQFFHTEGLDTDNVPRQLLISSLARIEATPPRGS